LKKTIKNKVLELTKKGNGTQNPEQPRFFQEHGKD